MVKTKVFPLSNGETGSANYPENGDVVTSRFAKVGVSEPRPALTKEGKAIVIVSKYLGVTDKDGKELTLVISDGQKKILDKTPDLTGKKIKFEEYLHKTYNKMFLRAKVL